jgi:hypothetical protein
LAHPASREKAKAGRHRGVVDTLLTLVIALGGIATGIGAIWAAVVARRQAKVTERSFHEQRQFLKEQNEFARRQTQLTEESLAQTERSLAEQSQSLREQNEQARLTLEYDLLIRLEERSENPHFLSRRREAAKYLLENAFEEGEGVAVERLNDAVSDVCDFFEEVGELQRLGVLRAEPVWNRYGLPIQALWLVCRSAIEKHRQEWETPALYEEFERLVDVMVELDRARGVTAPTRERVRQIFEDEVVKGEEPSTTEG